MTITLPRITVLRVRVTNSSLVLKSTPRHLSKHPLDFLTFSVSGWESLPAAFVWWARGKKFHTRQISMLWNERCIPAYPRKESGPRAWIGISLTWIWKSPRKKKKQKGTTKPIVALVSLDWQRGLGTLWISHRVFEVPPNLQGSSCLLAQLGNFLNTEQGSHLVWDFRYETGCWLMGLN